MSIPKCKDFSDYNRYPSDPNPTTDADMQEYMANQNELMKIVAGMLWQPKTYYEKDQQIQSDKLPSGTVAIATTAGMSDENEPTWGDLGDSVVDGSVVWKISRQKGGDGVPIGTVSWWFGVSETIPQGSVALDGAEYDTNGICKPLFDIIGYKYGGSGNTFNVPNLIGKYIKGDTVAGTELEAGLPNIEGRISTRGGVSFAASGAFTWTRTATTTSSIAFNTSQNNIEYLDIDASRSNSIYGNSDTVQPPSLTAIPIIKAFSADVESIEPTTEQQLRADVALQASAKANKADVLTLEEIEASTDLTDKIASASALEQFLIVEQYASNSQNIAGSSLSNFSVNVSKNGYKFIGIVGVIPSTGNAVVIQFYKNGNNAAAYIWNKSSSQISAIIRFDVLYVKER